MCTADLMQAKLREKPFVPVRIVTSSGQADLVMVGRNALVIGTASKENPTQFGVVSRVAILHVTDLQDIATLTQPSGSNGQLS